MITKDHEVCFLSHLEYMKTIERAIKRAKLPVAYSEGFNPHMKFSLASALGVGVSSHAEHCELELSEELDGEHVVQALCDALPRGIRVLKFDIADKKAAKLMASVQAANYIATVQERQGLMVACPEEIAFRMNYISREQLMDLGTEMNKNGYGKYLVRLAKETRPF